MPRMPCLRKPIPELREAARLLDAAVTAHALGHHKLADQLFRIADMPALREWTESLWGRNSSFVRVQFMPQLPLVSPEKRVPTRMPTTVEKKQLHERDGFHCRFCEVPVIRKEVRQRVSKCYPKAVQWGKKNIEQHAAFQALWAQYDHIVPHSRGGTNDLDNVVVTCAPCNFARMEFSLEEVNLLDPRKRNPLQSEWDGLERFRS